MTEYRPTNVETIKLQPLIGELVARCGSPEKAAEYAGIGVQTVYRIIYRHHKTMQARTARLIVLALYQRRKEDRRNGSSEQFKTALRKQARIEESLDRLAGY